MAFFCLRWLSHSWYFLRTLCTQLHLIVLDSKCLIHYQRVLIAMGAANLISTEEVAKHNAASDCWVSIKTSSLCLAG